MRVLPLGLVLLFLGMPLLAGCLGATEEAADPGGLQSEAPGDEAATREVRTSASSFCGYCATGPQGEPIRISGRSAVLEVEVPRPVNATLLVSWTGAAPKLKVYGAAGGVEFKGEVTQGGSLEIPMDGLTEPTEVRVDGYPATMSVYASYQVEFELVLTYNVPAEAT